MANFDPAFDYMMRNEDSTLSGKVTAEPNGAKARFGINSKSFPNMEASGFYNDDVTTALQKAKTFYLNKFWAMAPFEDIPSQQVASKLFDMAVNMGLGGLLQVLGSVYSGLRTSSLHSVFPLMTEIELPKIVEATQKYYQRIADNNPDKYDKYLHGWLARAAKLPPADISG